MLLVALRCLSSRDPLVYCRMLQSSPYILSCVLSLHLAGMRRHALTLMASAYGEGYAHKLCVPWGVTLVLSSKIERKRGCKGGIH